MGKMILCVVCVLVLTGAAYAESVYIVEPNLKEVKFKSIMYGGQTVNKPNCPSGWIASIFITPAIIVPAQSGGQPYPIAGFNPYAADNGTYWTVKVQVKDSQNTLFEDYDATTNPYTRVLVEAMCCPAGGSCI